jgi:hypothetical protein
MPGGFPLIPSVANASTIGANTGSTTGTVIAANAAANTKGSFVQISASTPIDASAFILIMQGANNAAHYWAMDVAVGAGGSEVVIANNIADSSLSASGCSITYIPVGIPAGTRVSGRSQAAGINDGVTAAIILLGGSYGAPSFAGVDALCFDPTGSDGVTVDPGAVANTKGSYVQLIASTSRDYHALMVNFDSSGSTASSGFPVWLIDVAYGAGGSEVPFLTNFLLTQQSSGSANLATFPHSLFIPFRIPSGTRLAGRAQCTITTAIQRTFGIQIYGLF